MKFELVELITKDGLIHQGMISCPETPGKRPHSAEASRGRAVLWVHGLGGKFYGAVKLLNLLAEACTARGMAFASFNTRGHDCISGLKKVDPNEPSGYAHVTIGAGLEEFTESVFDIDGAITYLVSRGYTEVILAGHSTGANKVCYYAAHTKDPRVTGVILAGPMSDRLYAKKNNPDYRENLTMIRELVDKNRGEALLTKTLEFPMSAKRAQSLLSPNSKEDVFNYGDAHDVLAVFQKIPYPLLIVLSGNDETADRPAEHIKAAFDAHTGSKNYSCVIIPESSHGYDGKQKKFTDLVIHWITKQLPAS